MNKVVRRIDACKKQEWRDVHNKELHNLCSSLTIAGIIIQMDDSWDMQHAWGKWEILEKFCWENINGRDCWKHLGIGERKTGEICWTGVMIKSSVVGFCEHMNEHSFPITAGCFLSNRVTRLFNKNHLSCS